MARTLRVKEVIEALSKVDPEATISLEDCPIPGLICIVDMEGQCIGLDFVNGKIEDYTGDWMARFLEEVKIPWQPISGLTL